MVERHEHYDFRGVLTGTTVVTREPLWDEDSRQAAYAEWAVELERCHQCGGPRSECSDPDRAYYPNTERCYRRAAMDVAQRIWSDTYEKTKPDGAGYLPSDGASISMLDYDPAPGVSWPSELPIS